MSFLCTGGAGAFYKYSKLIINSFSFLQILGPPDFLYAVGQVRQCIQVAKDNDDREGRGAITHSPLLRENIYSVYSDENQ